MMVRGTARVVNVVVVLGVHGVPQVVSRMLGSSHVAKVSNLIQVACNGLKFGVQVVHLIKLTFQNPQSRNFGRDRSYGHINIRHTSHFNTSGHWLAI